MGSLHWLILVPYYFFTAVCMYLALCLVCRVIRLAVSASPLATIAVVSALVLTAALSRFILLGQYRWQGLVALLAISAVLAALDSLLAGPLKLPLDDELKDI